LLCFSILIPFLKDNVVCTDTLSNSLHWELRSEVEWLTSKEALASLFTLLNVGFFTHLVSIYNSPSLSCLRSTISVLWLDYLSFFIGSILDSNDLLVVDIGEVTSLILEDLPPVRAGAVDLHMGSLTFVVDIEGLIVVSISNSS